MSNGPSALTLGILGRPVGGSTIEPDGDFDMRMSARRVAARIGVGLALVLVTTTLATGDQRSPTPGAPAKGDGVRAPAGGLVMAEDGSWVPRSYYATELRGANRRDVASSESERREDTRVPGSFIVDLASGLDPDDVAEQIARDYGGEVEFIYDEVVGGFAFRGPDDALERMRNDPRIRDVDTDHIAHLATHTLPLERTAIRAPEAWAVSQGSGAVVAIIDTGVNSSHPQLAGRILGRDGSCVNETGSNAGADGVGHGTTVAGHIFGHYGVLPAAAGYAVKVFPTGAETTTYAKIICGLNLVKSWAPTRGIHAANLSLSGTADSSTLRTAVAQLRDAGVVVVASVGNDGGFVEYPAAYPETVAVSAMNTANTRLAFFSNPGPEIDMGAPGENLLSLTLSGCCSSASGTSFAAPQVAAAAALVRSRQPSLSVAEVVATLQKTGFCPPGTSAGLNTDGGSCSTQRDGDFDGSSEPALNLEGAALGVDAVPNASFVSPTAGQVIRNATFSTIRVSATDDDTASSALDVDVRVGSGTYQQATYNASASPCPVSQTCHDLAWPTATPDGPVSIVAQVREPSGGTRTVSVSATVDNIDNPPTVSWQIPAAGSTVASPVFLRVGAADDRGLASVKVFEGSTEKATLTRNGSFYEGSVPLSEAGHTLTAVASDGAQTATAQRTFTVSSFIHQQNFNTTGAWSGGWYEASSSLWHPTSACAAGAAAPPFAYYGNDSTCRFSTSLAGTLYSPLLTGLSGGKVRLTFDSKEQVESCSGCTRDRRIVEVNYGSGWQRLYYQNAGTNSGSGLWERREYLLNPCAGSAQIRFAFKPRTEKNNEFFGWGIDNVTFSRTTTPLTC